MKSMQKTILVNKHMSKGVSLGQVPQVIMIIVMIGVILGAGYITLVAFQNTTTCTTSKLYVGIGYVISMLDAVASNLPTIGIMIFVGVLLSVVFWMFQTGKFGGGKGKGA